MAKKGNTIILWISNGIFNLSNSVGYLQWSFECQERMAVCLLDTIKCVLYLIYRIQSRTLDIWCQNIKKKLHSPRFYELGTPRPILPYCNHTAVGFPFPIRFKIFKVGPSRQTNTVGLIKTAIFQMTWRIYLHCLSSLERNWIFALSGQYINFDEAIFSCIITWNNEYRIINSSFLKRTKVLMKSLSWCAIYLLEDLAKFL